MHQAQIRLEIAWGKMASKKEKNKNEGTTISYFQTRRHKILRLIARGVGHFYFTRHGRHFENFRDYFQNTPVVGYIGWVGHFNAGDEGLFLSFKNLFRPFQVICYPNNLPTELLIYRTFIKKNIYDFVLLGGGTLIGDDGYFEGFQKSINEGSHTVVFGTGVKDPIFWSKRISGFQRKYNKWMRLLDSAKYIAVRGPLSKAKIQPHLSKDVKVIGDPALTICKPRSIKRKYIKRVGINLRGYIPMRGSLDDIEEILSKVVHSLLRKNISVEFMPLHPLDYMIGRAFIRKFNLREITCYPNFFSVRKIIERIRRYDCFISERLHGTIFAAGQAIPTISLSYLPKCDDFMESFEIGEFGLPTDKITTSDILSRIEFIELNYGELCKKLTEKTYYFKNKQKEAAKEVKELLRLTASSTSE